MNRRMSILWAMPPDGSRMSLLDVDKRKEADEYARKVEYIELTVNPDFEKTFAKSMWIPHMKDKFPNLSHILPQKKVNQTVLKFPARKGGVFTKQEGNET